MADIQMNQLATASDANYIYAETADGSQVRIAKADLYNALIASKSSHVYLTNTTERKYIGIKGTGLYSITYNSPLTSETIVIALDYNTPAQTIVANWFVVNLEFDEEKNEALISQSTWKDGINLYIRKL